MKRPPSLTFSDGLNFGCGFFVAGFLFFIFFLPLATVGVFFTLAFLSAITAAAF